MSSAVCWFETASTCLISHCTASALTKVMEDEWCERKPTPVVGCRIASTMSLVEALRPRRGSAWANLGGEKFFYLEVEKLSLMKFRWSAKQSIMLETNITLHFFKNGKMFFEFSCIEGNVWVYQLKYHNYPSSNQSWCSVFVASSADTSPAGDARPLSNTFEPDL